MKVVALLSGGKDSCFSLLKVRSYNHEVVAVAHITPPSDEPDSFMYQSVGSAAVPFIAEALGLPLVLHPTHAKAKKESLYYSTTPGDEVEDLVTLLKIVKNRFPDVDGVCAGALWSDYQRLRVENAASRVGFLSLAPLWRRDQTELLNEMIATGVHAVLLKVAGVGLNHGHLGRSLAYMRPTLRKLESLYGSHVCGEGGEYETLVLWMPGFQKKLVLEETETVIHSDDPVAPVSYLKINKVRLEEDNVLPREHPVPDAPLVPPVFQFDNVSYEEATPQVALHHSPETDSCIVTVGKSDRYLYVSIHTRGGGYDGVVDSCGRLQEELRRNGESLRSVLFVQLYVQSTSGPSYLAANKGYKVIFDRPECVPPPARACIGASSAHEGTTIEALVRRGERSMPVALHVQSLSEWAPPCIGPYSQFVEEDGIVHVSGVLPLYAPTASVPAGMPIGRQIEACARNLRSTLDAGRSSMEKLGFFIVFIVATTAIGEVEEHLGKHFPGSKKVFAVIPASSLPKGALVEIRAVGVLDEEHLTVPSFSPSTIADLARLGVAYKGVSCGSLSFLLLSIHKGGEGCTLGEKVCTFLSIIRDSTLGGPISLQVYGKTTIGHSTQSLERLRSVLPNSSVSVFEVSWLPYELDACVVVSFVA